MKTLTKLAYMAIGMILAAAIGVTSSVIAANTTKTVQVTAKNIKVYIDGTETPMTDLDSAGNVVEPVIMFDKIYVPISPLARAFGKTAVYDGETNILSISTKESIPIGSATKLSDLDYFTKESLVYFYNDDKDNTGTVVKDIVAGTCFLNPSMSWYIKQQYTKLSGGICLPYDARNTDGVFKIKIWGDDDLLYESPRVMAGGLPFDFSVDIQGVNVLKVSWEKTGGADYRCSQIYVTAATLYK